MNQLTRQPTTQILNWAQLLWDYHHTNHTLLPSDCILVLGSNDVRVAERGAHLYLEGMAPWLLFSGGLGNFTKGLWDEPEADKFAKIAYSLGVPKDAILIENKSTNTGENIRFTKQVLSNQRLDPQRFIVVQKPFMERRSYATFKQNWPEKELVVTSPQIVMHDYPNDKISFELMVNAMVGDLERIKVYPEMGFQIYQEIPKDVWAAFEGLVDLGFDKHLISKG
ncbi:MAG TPA: YdcF family protein [Lunatimonas sp.]|nr:YdcF family protein [Lunatimonas sp.]